MIPDSDSLSSNLDIPESFLDQSDPEFSLTVDDYACLSVDEVQTALGRSRASIYRYANTSPDDLNPPFDRKRLNPELRKHKDDPLIFHPSEVERFARDILGIQQVTIEVQPSEQAVSQRLLRQVLQELKAIRRLLEIERRSPSDGISSGSDT